MAERLHIVSFDVPYPPDYGGAIDVFYKLRALHDLGVEVVLHVFVYGDRTESKELEKYCRKVFYYSRNMEKWQLLSDLPFTVISRKNDELVQNILSDPAPVILEGWHTAGNLIPLVQSGLNVFVREHNIEWKYYLGLVQHTKNLARKFYYATEARKLFRFEKDLRNATMLWTISAMDREYHLDKGNKKVEYLPVFHPNKEITSVTGSGYYASYHGNLSVEENSAAVKWLLEKVWPGVNYPLKIAGKNPPEWLMQLIDETPNAEYVAGADMEQLVREAHIHVLPAMQDTGIKLKLLSALFTGRHCLVNSMMVSATGLEEICHIADDPGEWQQKIKELSAVPFGEAEIEKRKSVLLPAFDNRANAQKIISSIRMNPSKTE